nr:MAG TPA: hypothetical protein [Caudoviricetes sp.]
MVTVPLPPRLSTALTTSFNCSLALATSSPPAILSRVSVIGLIATIILGQCDAPPKRGCFLTDSILG